MILTAYLEMFHGSILLNCKLCGCNYRSIGGRKKKEIKVALNTISRYLNLHNLIEDKTKLFLNGRLDRSMMEENHMDN